MKSLDKKLRQRACRYLREAVGSDWKQETSELPRLLRLLRSVAREARKEALEEAAVEAEKMCGSSYKVACGDRLAELLRNLNKPRSR